MRVNRQFIVAVLLVTVGILLVGAAFFWFQFIPASESAQPVEDPGDIPYPEIPRVSLSDAKAAYELKNATFIDVRDSSSFARGHIPGARSIPVDELSEKISELNPSDWYILYCT